MSAVLPLSRRRGAARQTANLREAVLSLTLSCHWSVLELEVADGLSAQFDCTDSATPEQKDRVTGNKATLSAWRYPDAGLQEW